MLTSVPTTLALFVSDMDVSQVVGLAFAVAASSFCPLLVLGIWWRGLTDVGAIAGLIAGGGAAVASVLVTVLGPTLSGDVADLVEQPAAWTVPLAFLVMVGGSLLTGRRVPADVNRPCRRRQRPGDTAEHRALSGPVRPPERNALPRLGLEIKRSHDLLCAEPPAEALDREQCSVATHCRLELKRA